MFRLQLEGAKHGCVIDNQWASIPGYLAFELASAAFHAIGMTQARQEFSDIARLQGNRGLNSRGSGSAMPYSFCHYRAFRAAEPQFVDTPILLVLSALQFEVPQPHVSEYQVIHHHVERRRSFLLRPCLHRRGWPGG